MPRNLSRLESTNLPPFWIFCSGHMIQYLFLERSFYIARIANLRHCFIPIRLNWNVRAMSSNVFKKELDKALTDSFAQQG